jgi:hypothetical protein
MAILIQYRDKTFGTVPNNELDTLIAAREIIGFRRSDGWVDVNSGALRGQGSLQLYPGTERRLGKYDIFSL